MSMTVNYSVDNGGSDHGHLFLDLATGHKLTDQRAGRRYQPLLRDRNMRANCVYSGQSSGCLNAEGSVSGWWFGKEAQRQ